MILKQLGPRFQSTAEFHRARRSQETDGRKEILPRILRFTEKPFDEAPETGGPVWLVGDGLFIGAFIAVGATSLVVWLEEKTTARK
jgi:hypothetical protein